jgi:hypothetical protein
MYGIKKEGKIVAVCKANTSGQAQNIYARVTKLGIETVVIKADEVYDLCVKQLVPLYEPESMAIAESSGNDG